MRILLALAAIMTTAGPLSAEEKIRRELPKESAWVRYHMTEKWDDGTERIFEFEIHVFAPETIQNRTYRWIELKLGDPSKSRSVCKWQVLEEDLKRGGMALVNSRKTWRKTSDGEPRTDDLEDSFARLYLFCPPPIEGAKLTGEKETIDWQQGKMECEIATVKKHDKFRTDETDTLYRLKLNPKVPLGIAGATLNVTDSEGVKGTIEYSLLDMGDKATSEIPE